MVKDKIYYQKELAKIYHQQYLDDKMTLKDMIILLEYAEKIDLEELESYFIPY